jgi:branched-chain amino acid transport system ATP-binding protein
MLDEPTAGMSLPDRSATAELIARIRETHGVTVLLTEHDMDVIFGLAKRMLVLNYGEVVTIGRADEVRADPHVREIYLGKEMVGA